MSVIVAGDGPVVVSVVVCLVVVAVALVVGVVVVAVATSIKSRPPSRKACALTDVIQSYVRIYIISHTSRTLPELAPPLRLYNAWISPFPKSTGPPPA